MRSISFALSATVLAASALFLQAAYASAVAPSETNLTSLADKMISFRHQKHSWVTDDGLFHVIYNSGSGSGDALQLSTSTDGLTWSPKLTLASTDKNSTSDGSLNGDRLSVVYSTSNKGINFAPLKYDATTQSWKLKGPGQVVRNGTDDSNFKGKQALIPSLVEDANGDFWTVFLEQNVVDKTNKTGTASLKLYYRAKDDKVWYNTGVTFGDAAVTRDLTAPKLSGRLVRTPKSIGVIFADGADIWWAERPAGGTYTDHWFASGLLIQGTPDSEADKDPYASHFSSTTDDQGNIHLVYADAKIPYYRRFNAQITDGGPAWSQSSIAFSTTSLDTGYPEVSFLGGSNIAVVFNAHVEGKASNLRVYQSASLGSSQDSFKCTHVLKHNQAPDSDPNQYQHMRNEMPAVALTSGVPVLLQYQVTENDATSYRALGYKFPVTTTPGCQQ